MKGAGAAIMTVIIILALIIMLVVYLNLVEGAGQRKLQLNLNEAELLRAKNTVFLVNQNLATTWRVAAVQMLFTAGEQSVGCGFDDLDLGELYAAGTQAVRTDDFLDDNYWYQYDPAEPKRIALPSGTNTYSARDAEPRICYPSDDPTRIAPYLRATLAPFLNIPQKIDVNGFALEIDDITPTVTLTDAGINVVTTQTLRTAFSNGAIAAETTIVTDVRANLLRLVRAGRSIVDEVKVIAEETTDPAQRKTSPLVWQPAVPKALYEIAVRQALERRLRDAVPDGTALSFSRADILPSTLTVALRTNGGREKGFGEPQTALLLTYDAKLIAKDAPRTATTVCAPPADDYRVIVEDAVDDHDWHFGGVAGVGDIAYGRDEIRAFVYGIVNTESGWDARAVSRCGAAGLMQLMPATGRALGLDPIFDDGTPIACDRIYERRLEAAIAGKTDAEAAALDARFDAEQNIRAGVAYLRDQFETFEKETSGDAHTKENIAALAIAAYNAGPGSATSEKGVRAFQRCAQSWLWDDMVAKGCAADETRDYVPSATACSALYRGGTERTTTWPWPTGSREITDCFGMRVHPITKRISHHDGIDIGVGERGEKDVVAAADGRVIAGTKKDCREGDTACGGGYGNTVRIDHGSYVTVYAHLSTVNVNDNDEIRAGEMLGTMGSTGLSTAPHLDFQVRDVRDSTPLNPCNFITCEETTEDTCTGEGGIPVDPTVFTDLHYQHLEAANPPRFVLRPFFLRVNVADTIAAIDCTADTRDEPFTSYRWSAPNDLACCGSRLWSCSAPVDGIGDHGLDTGEKVTDVIPSGGGACDEQVERFLPVRNCAGPGEPARFVYAHLVCTETGFVATYDPC